MKSYGKSLGKKINVITVYHFYLSVYDILYYVLLSGFFSFHLINQRLFKKNVYIAMEFLYKG